VSGVKVTGPPAPKGSMKCVAKHAPGHHARLVEQLGPAIERWRDRLEPACAILRADQPLTGPLTVDVTVTLPRPASAPLAKRPWPAVRNGDIDKLARTILDALTANKVIADDSLVVELTARKCYPDTPGCPDRLDRPGAIIRIYPIGE
jgi:Holliday junction resolvase RusA-like endonuclease